MPDVLRCNATLTGVRVCEIAPFVRGYFGVDYHAAEAISVFPFNPSCNVLLSVGGSNELILMVWLEALRLSFQNSLFLWRVIYSRR